MMNTRSATTGTVRRASRLAVLLVAGCVAPAAAQSNSLFHRGTPRPQRVPTTQPAGAAREALLPATPPAVIHPLAASDPQPPRNAVLLHASLIAVEAPKPRRIKVHDIVTVIVREEKRAKSDTDLKRDKKWDISAELKKWIRLTEDSKLVPQVFPAGNPAIELAYDDKYKGKGKVERKDSLVTRISAMVIDVKPNGTLVLQARKEIKIDEDRQRITLTGVCRAEDVSAQNTILSTQLADATIDIQHAGPARDAARRGWLAKLWDVIRPL